MLCSVCIGEMDRADSNDNQIIIIILIIWMNVSPECSCLTGYMSLFMPTWHPVREADMPALSLPPDLAAELPPEMVELEHRTQVFLQ